MELADPRLIRQLTEAYKAKKSPRLLGPRMTKKASDASVYQPPVQKSRRCHCGICSGCKENARWDRIFAEKFADPSYYSDLTVRRGSPLDGI